MARYGSGPGTVERPAISIVHDIPGRLRLRLASVPGLEDLARELTAGAVPGVVDCVWSPRTGSLRIHYDRAALTAEPIVDWVARRAAADKPEPERVPSRSPVSGPRATFATALRATMVELNRRVTRVTGGTLDLSGVFVASLLVWAAREMVRGRMVPLAWSTALWYAHGLFHDYHVTADEE